MSFRAFTVSSIFQGALDSKDKLSIQCVDSCHPNLYIGTKQGTVHLLVHDREASSTKLSSSPVLRLRLVPVFHQLLTLCHRTVSALHMSTLETNPRFKKIHNVSLFEICNQREEQVRLVLCPREKKLVRVLVLAAEGWVVLREVALVQEPVEVAVGGDSVCVATVDRYLLCDWSTGQRQDLFQHGLKKQQVLVRAMGTEEFLLNGPGGLGLCVLASGLCQRPPLPWPQDVLAACVCFPYVLSLRAHTLEVYSLLDQQCKQSVSVSAATGLVSSADGALLVFTERSVFSLSPVPEQEQIQALVQEDRLEEALQLLEEGVSRLDRVEQQKLQRSLTCRAGFQCFFQEKFPEAKDLFIKCNLDPRELLYLYPDLHPTLAADFQLQQEQTRSLQDQTDSLEDQTDSLQDKTHSLEDQIFSLQDQTQTLQDLWLSNSDSKVRYLLFLRDFLRVVRSAAAPRPEVDSALLWLYVHIPDDDSLLQLLALPNACKLELCQEILRRNSRFYALGQLYHSFGRYQEAIQTWVDIVDGVLMDQSCSDVLDLIVSTLSQLEDRDTVRTFTPWTLQKNQKVGVQIFTKRPAIDQFQPEEVLVLLEPFPHARTKYLEFLIYECKSEAAGLHTLLTLAYVSLSLQDQENEDIRKKLQQLLWDSNYINISAVYEQLKATPLQLEKAIALGRLGDHFGALTLLTQNSSDLTFADEFCLRLTSDSQSTLLLTLLNILVTSEGKSTAALHLLNKHSQALSGEAVLGLLPESWSVGLLSDFLMGAVRKVYHLSRMKKVQGALEHAQLLRHRALWMRTTRSMLTLDGRQACDVCSEVLTGPEFVLTAQRTLRHLHCTEPF